MCDCKPVLEGWWSQSITDLAIVRLTACLGSHLGSHRNSHLNYGGQMAGLHFLIYFSHILLSVSDVKGRLKLRPLPLAYDVPESDVRSVG